MAIGGAQFPAQGRERITVPRSSSVEGDIQLAGDLVEGEFAPDLEHKDFALLDRKPLQRGLDRAAAVIGVGQRGEETLGVVSAILGMLLAVRSPAVAPREVEGGASDRGEQQRMGIAAEDSLATPITHEGILDHVLGISQRTRPLPGA